MAGATPGAEAAQELYTELECEVREVQHARGASDLSKARLGLPCLPHIQVFHELEQFVSDPHFVAALDRPAKDGKAGLLQRWTNWAQRGSNKGPKDAQSSEAVSCCEDEYEGHQVLYRAARTHVQWESPKALTPSVAGAATCIRPSNIWIFG